MIEEQSYHHGVNVTGTAVRKHTAMTKEVGVVKKTAGTEARDMMTTRSTTATTDLVIEALLDMMIVITGGTRIGAEIVRMLKITDEGINLMVNGAIEMTTKRASVTGEMKLSTGKGAQKIDIAERTVDTVTGTTSIMMIGPTRKVGPKIIDSSVDDCLFCVATTFVRCCYKLKHVFVAQNCFRKCSSVSGNELCNIQISICLSRVTCCWIFFCADLKLLFVTLVRVFSCIISFLSTRR
jgi:hypothetical protein